MAAVQKESGSSAGLFGFSAYADGCCIYPGCSGPKGLLNFLHSASSLSTGIGQGQA